MYEKLGVLYRLLWHTVISLVITELIGVGNSQFHSGFMDSGFLEKKAARINTSDTTVFALPNQLRLVTTSRFTCDGTITGFYLGATVHLSRLSYPRAEVWRRVDDDAEDDRRRRRSRSASGGSSSRSTSSSSSTSGSKSTTSSNTSGIIDDEAEGGYSRRDWVELRPTFRDFQPNGIYLYMMLVDTLSFSENDIFAVYQPPPSESNVVLQYTNRLQSYQSTSLVQSTYSSFVSGNSQTSITNQYLLIQPISEESNCLEGFLHNETIQSLFPEIGNLKRPMQELRLFPDMRFKSVGLINTWIIGSTVDSQSGEANTEIQIWRNSSSNTSYIRVAAYELNERSSVLISQNVRKYHVNPPICVLGGDIVGIFQPSNSSINVYYQEHNGPKNIVIPVAEGFKSSEITFNMLASSSINDYPLVTVKVSNVTTANASTAAVTTGTVTIGTVSSSIENHLPKATVNVVTAERDTTINSAIAKTIKATSLLQFIGTSITIASSSSISSSTSKPTLEPLSSTTNEALLLSVTIIGSLVILVTVPLIVILLVTFIYKRLRRKGTRMGNIETNRPSTKEPLALSHSAEEDHCNMQNRESMQDNPLYYYPVVPRGYTAPVPTLKQQLQEKEPDEVLYEEIIPRYN